MQLHFDDFTLDTDSRRLRRGDAERHLSPKAFELLRLLVDNRPRALSKAELHERLWPATFVSEATLSSLVGEVRDALGEHARDGKLVRTVHRFGYAFDGTVQHRAASASLHTAPPRCWVIWEYGHIALGDGEHLVGRDGDVAVWLESPTISRHHARISIAGEQVAIEDLGSKNGTFLHGKRLVAPARLGDGDEIQLGSVAVKVRLPKDGSSTVTIHSA